jgi:hypothetical protein
MICDFALIKYANNHSLTMVNPQTDFAFHCRLLSTI